MSAPPQVQVQPPPPDPSSFGWQNTSLTAVGRGAAPSGTSPAQREIAGQNAARVAALKDLKSSVRQLPVGMDQTVGSIMDNYIGIRRAIEKQIQQAQVVSQQAMENGQYEVQVEAPLQPVADILKKNYITPNEELPKPPSKGDELGVPALT